MKNFYINKVKAKSVLITFALLAITITTSGQGPISPTGLIGPNEIAIVWESGYSGATNDEDISVIHNMFKVKKDHESHNTNNKFNEYPERITLGNYGSRIINGTSGDFNGDGVDEYVVVSHAESNQIRLQIPMFDSLTFDSAAFAYTPGPVSSLSSAGLGIVLVESGDLNNDGNDEFVIVYANDTSGIVIKIFDIDTEYNITQKSTKTVEKLVVSSEFDQLDLQVSDLNNDGNGEVILAYKSNIPSPGYYTNIYSVDNTFNPALKVKKKIGSTPTSDYDKAHLALTVGDFDGDSVSDLAFAIATYALGYPKKDTVKVYPLEVNSELNLVTYDKNNVLRLESFVNPTPMDITSGDLNGDGRNEIALGIDDVILLETKDSTGLKLYNNQSFSGYFYGSLKFLSISNIDGVGSPELVYAESVSGIAIDFRVVKLNSNLVKTETWTSTVEDESESPHSFMVLTGDFDGDRFEIGPGKKYTKTDILQPIVILNAPPTHFDKFDQDIFDVNTCYGSDQCDSYVTYTVTSSEENSVSTTLKESWAVSARVEGGGSAFGVSASAYVEAEYAEYFENSETNTDKITITQTVTASEDDLLYATVCDYEIWEYPILNQNGQITDNIITLKPLLTENRWFPSKERSASGYIPKHEVGNILSYTPFTDLINPDGEDKLRGSYGSGSYDLNETSDITYEVDFQSTFNSESSVEREIGLEVGGSIGGWGIEISGSARYDGSNLSTHTVEVDKGLNISIHLGGIDRSIGETNYNVTPYIYWSKNGALVVDYAVRPILPEIGGTDTWWSANYDVPDPAFVLPWRLDPEKGLTLQDEVKRKRTKSIYFSPRESEPGDTITITAIINNFSPYPTGNKIPVSFYIGDPNDGGTLISDINGKSVFETDGVIENQNYQQVSMKLIVPSGLQSFPRIYGYIDPGNSLTEVHEDNNIGWAILGKSDEEGNVNINSPISTIKQNDVIVYPNPVNAQSALYIEAEEGQFVNVRLYNTSGQLVSELWNDEAEQSEIKVDLPVSTLREGVYFYKVQSGTVYTSGKFIYLK